MMRLILILGALWALMSGPAHAQSVERIDVTEFGTSPEHAFRLLRLAAVIHDRHIAG